MPTVAGARLDRVPGPKYKSKLRYAEFDFPSSLPSIATLKRWRAELPADFILALRAPKATWHGESGALRLDESLRKNHRWLLDASEVLGICALVLPTGAELTTGQRDRDLLRAYLELFPQDRSYEIVWAPAGLWEYPQAQEYAHKLGIVAQCDPLKDDLAQTGFCYATLSAAGARKRFSTSDLIQITQALSARSGDALLSIHSSHSFREAVEAQTLIDTHVNT